MNTDFVVQRKDHWAVLMLAAAVISFLTSSDFPNMEVDSLDWYVTVVAGVCLLIGLYHLHQLSLPTDPVSHAVRRDKDAAMMWLVVQQGYALALVLVGATLSSFLRYLVSVKSDREPIQQWDTACIFCISLAVVFGSLDIMALLHTGWKKSKEQMGKSSTWMIACWRFVVLIATATMSLWMENGRNLALFGVGLVGLQLGLRKSWSWMETS